MTAKLRLTKAGAGALAVAVVMLVSGLMKTINLLILLGDLLLVLLVLNAFIACWRTRGLTISAKECLSRSGRTAWHSARLVALRRVSVPFVVRQRSEVHESSTFSSATVEANEATTITWKVPSLPRGVYHCQLSVECGYPFGFVRCLREASETHELRAMPALGTLDRGGFLRWLDQSHGGDARTQRRLLAFTHSGDVRGVRRFQSGDSPRHVHWRTTARRNELFARDFESRDAQDLTLFLALKRGPGFEDALSLAASIVQAWCGNDSASKLCVILPGEAELAGPANRRFAERVGAALAGVEPGSRISLPSARRGSFHIAIGNDAKTIDAAPWKWIHSAKPPAWYIPPKANGGRR